MQKKDYLSKVHRFSLVSFRIGYDYHNFQTKGYSENEVDESLYNSSLPGGRKIRHRGDMHAFSAQKGSEGFYNFL
jgi:hypothetical protein